MIDYLEFKRLFDASAKTPGFYINIKGIDKEYIIIKYEDSVQFSRCGNLDATEARYSTLEELMDANQVDGINLRRDWDKIERIYPEGYGGSFEIFCEINNIEYRGELTNKI